MRTTISTEKLVRQFDSLTAVDEVDLEIQQGEIYGFLGPNGAGKSTTMRILACFMPASGGVARVAGHDVFRESMEVRRRIGYLPENVPLYPDLRVASYLDFVAEVKGVSRSERRRRVADVMDRCMVADVQNRLIGKLSKGYRQRVGLAQAIISDPEVLILDEPTIGLDPKQITEIRSLIKSLAGQHTVILSTHILPEVSMVCSGVIIINKGAIVAQGPIDTLVEQFFPTARVEVEIVGPPPSVRDRIRSIPGVLSVEDQAVANGAGRYVVEAARGRDVRAEIFKLAAGQRWDLLELKRVGMTLEEVFIRVVAGEEGGAVGEAGEATAPGAAAKEPEA
jgi:gliding motility-associated transport system ATP-binding protein